MATTDRVDGESTGTTTTQVTAAGRTIIDDSVVAKVAGIAARAVPGVHALGGNATRAFGAIRDAVGSTALGQGVRVEVGQTQAAVDVTLVVEYPVPMQTVADAVRRAVADAVTDLVGLEVTEVNVAIVDVDVPMPDAPVSEPERRVR